MCTVEEFISLIQPRRTNEFVNKFILLKRIFLEQIQPKPIWNMHRSINIQNSIPDDVALKIVSSLQVFDICSLGSCSKFWRELCASDCLWEGLCKNRWPTIFRDGDSSASQDQESGLQGWREVYISKHNDMVEKAVMVTDFVERALAYESIEVGNYLKAIELLNSEHFGFEDVQMLLLKPELNVLLNLVGLHYSMVWLGIPSEDVTEALNRNQISERQVCVQWWKLGRWFYGFRLRDEFHSRNVSLGDLVVSNAEVLSVLYRGAIHEVIRVQISAAKPIHTSWSYQA